MSTTTVGEIFAAVKEAINLIRELTDPERIESISRIKRIKNLGKAVNYAEKMINIMDKFVDGMDDKSRKEYLNLKERFEKYD